MNETVHNRIAVLRVERGISRRDLAEALGVHYQTVGYLERGEYSPSLFLALRIAAFFAVPVEVIFSTAPFPLIGQSPVGPAPPTDVPSSATASAATGSGSTSAPAAPSP